jgi:Spy/CpxP family protein refolding chaperone
MKSLLCFLFVALFSFNVCAKEIKAESLNLTAEQNQKLTEMKEKLKAEVEPIWEEIESGKNRILEIEKKYFEEFWNMLTEEQKAEFTKINQQ